MSAEERQDEKRRLRHEYRKRGAALSTEYRAGTDRAIREAVLKSVLWQAARGVFLYVSVGSEPDTRGLIDAALAEGKRVYVPRCFPAGVMRAVRLRRSDELRPGAYGIPEPPPDGEEAAEGEIDLAIVPCVSATAAGARLGHGAGYYDRFLSSRPCPTMCLCYKRLLSDELPMGEKDVWMDMVVTEE